MGWDNTHLQLSRLHWDLLIPLKTINQNAPWQKRITWECCDIDQNLTKIASFQPSVAQQLCGTKVLLGASLAPIEV